MNVRSVTIDWLLAKKKGRSALPSSFHSGFVSIIGRPNVGKSTLLNFFAGEKIAIVSNKPQTTRNRIQGVVTDQDFQAVFVDTPGIHSAKRKLDQYMAKTSRSAVKDADCILWLIEPKLPSQEEEKIIRQLEEVSCPVLLVINKIDTVPRETLLGVMEQYRQKFSFSEIVPISALKGENTDTLLGLIKSSLPEGPAYFPENTLTDQPEKQLMAELIREKALLLLQEEIPHGIAVTVTAVKKRENQDLVDVQATIYCEKESHKGIIIGKQGAKLKKIGAMARRDMERLLGTPIFLETWVKVKQDWRNSDFLLQNFGYDKKNV